MSAAEQVPSIEDDIQCGQPEPEKEVEMKEAEDDPIEDVSDDEEKIQAELKELEEKRKQLLAKRKPVRAMQVGPTEEEEEASKKPKLELVVAPQTIMPTHATTDVYNVQFDENQVLQYRFRDSNLWFGDIQYDRITLNRSAKPWIIQTKSGETLSGTSTYMKYLVKQRGIDEVEYKSGVYELTPFALFPFVKWAPQGTYEYEEGKDNTYRATGLHKAMISFSMSNKEYDQRRILKNEFNTHVNEYLSKVEEGNKTIISKAYDDDASNFPKARNFCNANIRKKFKEEADKKIKDLETSIATLTTEIKEYESLVDDDPSLEKLLKEKKRTKRNQESFLEELKEGKVDMPHSTEVKATFMDQQVKRQVKQDEKDLNKKSMTFYEDMFRYPTKEEKKTFETVPYKGLTPEIHNEYYDQTKEDGLVYDQVFDKGANKFKVERVAKVLNLPRLWRFMTRDEYFKLLQNTPNADPKKIWPIVEVTDPKDILAFNDLRARKSGLVAALICRLKEHEYEKDDTGKKVTVKRIPREVIYLGRDQRFERAEEVEPIPGVDPRLYIRNACTFPSPDY